MAAGAWKDWAEGELVTEALFQDIQDSIAFIYSSESAANSALTNKVEGTQFFDTTDDVLKIWNGSAWIAVAGNRALLASATASASSSIALDNFVDNSTYSYYEIVGNEIVPSSDGAQFRFNFRDSSPADITGTYRTSGYGAAANLASSFFTTNNSLTDYGRPTVSDMGAATNERSSFIAQLFPNNAVDLAVLRTFSNSVDTNGTYWTADQQIWLQTSTAVKGLEYFASTGNLASGVFKVYGVKL